MENITYLTGAIPDSTDLRDYKIKASALNLPESHQLDYLPKVKDQKSVCSCVAHAFSSAIEYLYYKECGEYIEASTDFIYGMQRVVDGREDKGMVLRTACKILCNYGDVHHATCPTNTEMPKAADIAESLLNNDDALYEMCSYKILSYARCEDDEAVKEALYSGNPVLFSVKWYHKYKMSDGVLTFDTSATNGYHAIYCYGYNDKGWLCQNSWGKLWGKGGRFILPYGTEMSDIWTIVDADNGMLDVIKPKNSWLNRMLNLLIKIFKTIFKFN